MNGVNREFAAFFPWKYRNVLVNCICKDALASVFQSLRCTRIFQSVCHKEYLLLGNRNGVKPCSMGFNSLLLRGFDSHRTRKRATVGSLFCRKRHTHGREKEKRMWRNHPADKCLFAPFFLLCWWTDTACQRRLPKAMLSAFPFAS